MIFLDGDRFASGPPITPPRRQLRHVGANVVGLKLLPG